MGKPVPISRVCAPAAPGWDIAFTQMSQCVSPKISACMDPLTRQFEALGLRCERQVRQTPRGVSAYLAVVGQRGLVCIVDVTLVDGMAVGALRGAAIDVRLLDACGDVVAQCGAAPDVRVATDFLALPDLLVAATALERWSTLAYLNAIAYFSLIPAHGRGIEPRAN